MTAHSSTELLVIGALIARPDVLAACGDLEIDDFTTFAARRALEAIREVGATGAVTVEAVASWFDENEYHELEGMSSDGWMDTSRRLAALVAAVPASIPIERVRVEIAELRRQRDDRYGGSLSAWLGDDEPTEDDSEDWHIRGLVAKDVPMFVAGDPKVGKTLIVESWAIALASGAMEWCRWPVYGRKRVLLMPREDSLRTTKVRLWQLARGAGLHRPHELEGWLEVEPTKPLNLYTAADVEKLHAAGKRFDIIFIDSFTTAHAGDENSTKDIARAMEPARTIAASTKTTIAFIHHYNGKGADNDQRGVKHRLRGASAMAGYARHIVGASNGPKRGLIELASDGNFEFQIEKTVVQLVPGTTAAGKKTLAYELVGKAADAALAAMREKVVALIADSETGYSSANAIWKDLGGNRPLVLAAVKAELSSVPVGRLEQIGKRIHARKPVPGTSQNSQVPGTGTGTAGILNTREYQAAGDKVIGVLEAVLEQHRAPDQATEPVQPEWWDR